MSDLLLDNVSWLAERTQGLARQAHAEYWREVDAIIRRRARDPWRIERLLDGLLDFCFDPDMLQLYKKLYRYYFFINPAATADYVCAYREMWESEEEAKPASAKKSRGKKGGKEG